MTSCPVPCTYQCYIQPPRAQICRPNDAAILPKDCVEHSTIYEKSFCPPACARRPPLRVHDNLKPAACKMEDNTIHKLSFPALPCVKTCPILPCNRNIIGEGPLSRVTTQRHDYVPKAMERVPSIVPPTHLRCSEQPMERTTIMNTSYVPLCAEPVRSYKPIAVYCKPDHPFQRETIAKMSYVPWPVKKKEHYPWACRGKYECPNVPMERGTIMSTSYQCNPCVPRRESIHPTEHDVLNSDKECMEQCTIYGRSFCPPQCAKRPPLRAQDNLKPAACKMDSDTIHKLSFPCLPVVKTCPILPCNRNIIGEGPLSCTTTQRHDYVPKVMERVPTIVPPTHLRCSEQPMDATTIMNASYVPLSAEPVRSYKPLAVYCKPAHPFQNETIAKMSYVPWPLKKKEHYPWACRGKYVCPSQPLEATSIYKASFPAPGTFMNCSAPVCPPPVCPAPACCPPPKSDTCKANCFGDCCKGVPVC